ncbi:hypothetical protein M514_07832 [Trichuris suis]|uniref:Uncharacterized protein n=1 Tax=Trichuris suis TaxID=68888 RepID=A0A085N5D5_9BILA|nr:hypothetical protein M513_07832 [Trichuris suis]KFD64681.1 hypothetical protein M514_07832 [Trichuris suis]
MQCAFMHCKTECDPNVTRVRGALRRPRTLARPESVGNRGFLVAAAANPFIDTASMKWTSRGPALPPRAPYVYALEDKRTLVVILALLCSDCTNLGSA